MNKIGKNQKLCLLIVSCIVLLTVTIGGVIAYLIAESTTISNEFQPVQVTCEVKETLQNNFKKDVYIQNTGDVDAYIRAFVIANWVSDEADTKVHSAMPKEDSDYKVEWGTENWKKQDNGYWYYVKPVVSKDVTKDLIEAVTVLTEAPAGFHLEIQVIATAIQAQPETVVTEQWGVEVSDDIIQ